MIPSAAVAVIERRSPLPAVLLVRRALRDGDPWSGHWALPGGRIQAEDADPLAAARRETAEEIGLQLDAQDWDPLSLAVAGIHRGHGLTVAPFHRRIDHLDERQLRLDAREIAAVHWLELAIVRNTSDDRCELLPGGGDQLWPHQMVADVPLWGFTWRVLTALYR